MTRAQYADERSVTLADVYAMAEHSRVRARIVDVDPDMLPAADMSRETGPDWREIERVWRYLKRGERVLLNLMREGKTPGDAAEVLRLRPGIPTRGRGARNKLACAAIDRLNSAAAVVQFYARWVDVIETLGDRKIGPKDLQAVRRLVRHRWTTERIAERSGYADAVSVCRWLRRIAGKCRDAGDGDVADMILEYLAVRQTRMGGDMDKWREDVKAWLLSRVGKVWYVWGGQSPFADRAADRVADCSGLVIEVLKRHGMLPWNYPDVTAGGLSAHFDEDTDQPMPGDLVFYGRSGISHVMFYVGKLQRGPLMWEHAVAGMCGGCRNMTRERARLTGAALWVRSGVRYRGDLVRIARVQ